MAPTAPDSRECQFDLSESGHSEEWPAVDAQVEEGQLTHTVLHLKPNPERPNVLQLERGLLPDDLALVPWLAMNDVGFGSHDGLPSS